MRLSRTIALPISSREFAQWLVPFQSPFYNNHNYVKQPISNSQQDAITKKKVDPEPFHLLPKSDNVHLRARNIGIAVSGGVDSMALVTLLARHYQSQRNDYSNVANLHAFIVDHKLRDNSTEEATFVAEQVQKLNVAPHVLTLDWTETESSQFYTEDNDNQSQRYNSNISIQRPDKTHLETKARLERYKAIAKQCHSLQIKDLFVGHHSGDQVETVVFRFSRASGIDGLAGIQDVAPLGVLNVMEGLDIRLVRPLLNASKERLRATCEDAGTLWVEDPSNQSLDYQRNVIRHYQHDVDESVKNDAQSKLFMLSTDSILEFRQRINKHRQFAWEQVKPWLNNVHFDSENGVCHTKETSSIQT
ncbi:hypothetical protein BGZ46_010629 [Entomortierella lignicola]|nr:hypothetical protein BGZ46_010629 [Entomortierella lignicola]